MESNIERDLQKRALILKKGIQELQSILGKVHNFAKNANNNKLIFIKRNVDKLNAVSKNLNNLDMPTIKESKESTFNKEMTSLYNETVANISKMQDLFRRQEAAEKKDLQYNGRFFCDQKNLDNLRLAHSNIRQMGLGLNMSKMDWNELERK